MAELRTRLTVDDNASPQYQKIAAQIEKFSQRVTAADAKLALSSDKVAAAHLKTLTPGQQALKMERLLTKSTSTYGLAKGVLGIRMEALRKQQAREIKQYGKATDATYKEVAATAIEIKKLGELNNQLNKTIRKKARTTKETGRMTKALAGFRKGLVEISPVIARALTSPITAAAVAMGALGYGTVRAVKTAATFEEAMVRAGAIAQVSSRKVRDLSEAVLDNSRATEHTATTVQEAAKALAVAGLSFDQIKRTLPAVLQLATVGAMDTAAATQALMGVMRGFDLPLSHLQRVNDVLAKASISVLTTIPELAEGFAKIGPIAAKYNISVEQAAATLAVLNDANIKGADAGTAYRNMLTRIVAPLGEARKALRGAKIELMDSNDQFIGMTELLKRLGPRVNDANFMMQVFQRRTLAAAMAAAAKTDKLEKLEEALRSAGGTAKDIATKQLDTFAGRMKLVKSELEALFIRVGSALIPIMKLWANAFLDFIPTLSWFVGKLGATAGVIMHIFSIIPQAIHGMWVALVGAINVELNELFGDINSFIKTINDYFEREVISPFDVMSRSDAQDEFAKQLGEVGAMYEGFRDKVTDTVMAFDALSGSVGAQKTALKELNDELKKFQPPKVTTDEPKGEYDRAKELKDISKHLDKVADLRSAAIDAEADKIEKFNAIKSGIITHYEDEHKKSMDRWKMDLEGYAQEGMALGDAFTAAFEQAREANASFGLAVKAGLHSMGMAALDLIKQEILGIAAKAAANAIANAFGTMGPAAMVAAGAIGAAAFGAVSMWANKLKPTIPEPVKMNRGGIITTGSVGVDSTMALLSKGEMVLPKSVTDQILAIAGKPQPSGSPARFAKGGIVADAPQVGGAGQGVSLNIQTLNIPSKGQTRRWIRDTLAPELKSLQRSNLISLA